MAQVALNNNVSETTQETPFFANFGKNPNLFMNPQQGPLTEKALVTAAALKAVHDTVKDKITKSQDVLIKSRHKDSKTGPLLKKGDKVYLLIKNLKTRKRSKKLDHIKVGPFLIAKRRSNLNYQLELLKDAQIHLVFYISLLELANPNATL